MNFADERTGTIGARALRARWRSRENAKLALAAVPDCADHRSALSCARIGGRVAGANGASSAVRGPCRPPIPAPAGNAVPAHAIEPSVLPIRRHWVFRRSRVATFASAYRAHHAFGALSS